MPGIASLLDDQHYRTVEALWAELTDAFGPWGPERPAFPHISYHVAERYDVPGVRLVLDRWAAASPPFRVRVAGLGVFTGPRPVVFALVVRGGALDRLHAPLWHVLSACSEGAVTYYHPATWVPHVTLAHGFDRDALPQVIGYLGGRSFEWDIAIDNLCFLDEDGASPRIRRRIPLTGA